MRNESIRQSVGKTTAQPFSTTFSISVELSARNPIHSTALMTPYISGGGGITLYHFCPEFVKMDCSQVPICIYRPTPLSPAPTPSILKIDLFVGACYDLFDGWGFGGYALFTPIYTLLEPPCRPTDTHRCPCDLQLSSLFLLPFLYVSKASANVKESGTKAEPVLTMNPRKPERKKQNKNNIR